MNNKRLRVGFLVLAMYIALGVIGVSSRESDLGGSQLTASSAVPSATVANSAPTSSDGGGAEMSVQWHSFLPGAFK